MAYPPEAVRTRLIAAVTAQTLTADTNVFLGRPRPEVAPRGLSVWCYALSSRDTLTMGQGASVQQTTVQVVVRGDRTLLTETLALARDCVAALDHPTITTYIGCQIQGAEPRDEGQDPEGRHRLSFEVVLTAVA